MPKFSSTNRTAPDDSAIFASSIGEGVHAESTSTRLAAVAAVQLDATTASTGAGVYAESRGGGAALVALQVNSEGAGAGVYGECRGGGHAIFGKQNNPNSDGAAIYGEHLGDKGLAGYFKGNVIVTGDISFPGADCAEDFTIARDRMVEPGTVMVINANGELEPCHCAYNRKVVGVVAGAGDLRPGIIMGRQEQGVECRQPIALVGRVYCKVDAAYGTIEIGDLLTSSPTPGHAMRVSDPTQAFGAVIGKAMGHLDQGLGLIPILIALQ